MYYVITGIDTGEWYHGEMSYRDALDIADAIGENTTIEEWESEEQYLQNI